MPSRDTATSTVASAAGVEYAPRSSDVAVRGAAFGSASAPVPIDVMVAPASAQPVSSASTWPVTTPSAITRSVCEADEELPARSVAVTASVSVSPTDAAAGTVNASVAGAVVNDPAGRPLSVAAICASPTSSDALMVALVPRSLEIVAPAAIETVGAVESRATITSACAVRANASVAVATRWFSPSVSAIVAANGRAAPDAGPSIAAVPLITTDASVGSEAVPLTSIVCALVSAPDAGEANVTIGAARSSVTARVTVCVFPAASVATIVTRCAPSLNPATDACHASCTRAAGAPFTLTVVAVASYTKPCATTGSDPTSAFASGAVTLSSGGV